MKYKTRQNYKNNKIVSIYIADPTSNSKTNKNGLPNKNWTNAEISLNPNKNNKSHIPFGISDNVETAPLFASKKIESASFLRRSRISRCLNGLNKVIEEVSSSNSYKS